MSNVILEKNPRYVDMEATWRLLHDAFRGCGGFADGRYLQAHPREWLDHEAAVPKVPSKKLQARRALARYENLPAMIVGSKHDGLFRQAPVRTMEPGLDDRKRPLEQWWQDVDGKGTHIDDFLAGAWTHAAALGCVWLLMDLGEADRPYLRVYSPLDVADWLQNEDGVITSVKVLEARPRESFTEPMKNLSACRVRVWTETDWALYESDGKILGQGSHPFGRLPLSILYAKRPPVWEEPIAQSILGDPKLYVDHYNLTSELRELLRAQTFGLLNVPLGNGPDAASVEQARTMLGPAKGTDAVAFTPQPATYLSPDGANVAVYQQERSDLVRTIYRLTSTPWESDSRDAEAAGSLNLKREDMNLTLAAYADEVERTDYEIAELFYRGTLGADVGPIRFKEDAIVIKYPDTFDVQPAIVKLQEAQAALALDWPSEVTAEIQLRQLDTVLPDLSPEKKNALTTAITAHATSQAQQQRDPMARVRQALTRHTSAADAA